MPQQDAPTGLREPMRRPPGRVADSAHRAVFRPWAAALAPMIVLALAAGCGHSSTSPTQPGPAGGPVYYTAIGASDAIGFGGSAPCVPFTACPDGTGYVQVIARRLGASGTSVTLMNLGIPAAVIGPDIQAIGIQHGRDIPANFIDQEMPFVPSNSTLVTIFAGGNDTNAIASAVNDGAAGSDPDAYMDRQIRAFGDDYATLVAGIRARAGSTRIVVANLPNFAGVPFTASFSLDEKRIMQKISVGFSTQVINSLSGQGIPVVDLLCDGRMYQPGVYSSDGFHPNDTGYLYLAEEMLEAINSPGTYPAPRSSCPQMAIVAPR